MAINTTIAMQASSSVWPRSSLTPALDRTSASPLRHIPHDRHGGNCETVRVSRVCHRQPDHVVEKYDPGRIGHRDPRGKNATACHHNPVRSFDLDTKCV